MIRHSHKNDQSMAAGEGGEEVADAQRRREDCLPDAAAEKPAGRVDVPSSGEEAPREDGR